MAPKPRPYRRKDQKLFFLVCISAMFVWFIYSLISIKQSNAIKRKKWVGALREMGNVTQCKVPHLEPFDGDPPVYFVPSVPCWNHSLLTYTRRQASNGVVSLHINKFALLHYSRNHISCCYIGNTTSRFGCKSFTSGVVLHDEVVTVNCTDDVTKLTVYKNVHAIIPLKKKSHKIRQNQMSVLFIGISSMSRPNLMRFMAKTHYHLTENNWIDLVGYNKIENHTFANIMAILTGMNLSTAMKRCDPLTGGKLDLCNNLWHSFKKSGYITALGEDQTNINRFNSLKTELWKQPPVDYYFRPYFLTAEKNLVRNGEFCLGPETAGERMLNLIKDFMYTFRNYPYFGLFWMSSFSHKSPLSASTIDDKFLQFMEDIAITAKDTMIVLFSDNGFNHGTVRMTNSDTIEDRLPLLHVLMPDWFKQKHLQRYQNLKTNSGGLTSAYDLYMTLQDVLALSGANQEIKSSDACPKCKSLFDTNGIDRNCQDAGIENRWCACVPLKKLGRKGPVAEMGAIYAIHQINSHLKKYDKEMHCTKYELAEVMSVDIRNNLFLIKFRTAPLAIFEATVSYTLINDDMTFSLEGGVSGINSHMEVRNCTQNFLLVKYCTCISDR